MPSDRILSFGPYRLDAANARLWCETRPVRLTAKALQVLSYLAERPGQLVTKDELFGAVWPDTVVSDATLTSNIQAVRQALKDDPHSPRFIETVHRQGFRFIGEVVRSEELGVKSKELGVRRVEQERTANGQEIDAVMPALRPSSGQAPAGIQEFQAEASGESPWIPASAGMTPLPSSPQNDVNGVGSLDEVQRNPGEKPETETRIPLRSIRTTELSSHPEQPLDAAALPTQRAWSMRGLVFMSLVLLVAVSLTVQYLSRPSLSTQSSALSPAAQQALPLPDKPSLIVLPFTNLSRDPDQDYFSDGLTDVLTGKLSSIASLFVIAQHSAFTYKGKGVKVQDVGREMGVQYVLEGSVQKAEQRIRITTQLIDAITGHQLWSEQYDRPLTDIFAVQDEIVQKIVTTLKLQLTVREQGWIIRKHTNNLEAYDYFLRGVEYYNRFTKEANAQARRMYEQAIALDPQYAEAYEWLDVTYLIEWSFGWSMDPQTLAHAFELAQKAAALDDSLPTPHWGLSEIYAVTQQYEQAIAEGQRAITLDPNNADSYLVLAHAFAYAGRPEEALKMMAQAMRLNPRPSSTYLVILGWAYYLAGRYTEAIATLQDAIPQSPSFVNAHLNLAASYLRQWLAQQGAADQTLDPAKAEVQRALDLSDTLPWNHIVSGYIDLHQQQYDQALAETERGVVLAPNDAISYATLALVLSCEGRTEEALAAAARASDLKNIILDEQFLNVGTAYAVAGHFEEARDALQRYLHRYPNILPAHLMLVAVYSELGQVTEARAEAAEVLRLNPHFSLEVHKQRMPIKDPAVLERHLAALRKAGLR